MAAVSDCFTVGSIVWCKTCHDEEVEGEVKAFDPQTKVLILKCDSSSGDPKLNNVCFLNLSYISELQVKKEVTTGPDIPQSLNITKLNNRIRNQVEGKKNLLHALSENISSEGQKLFIAINKVFEETRWRNAEIVVFNNDVIISPPYLLENIRGNVNHPSYTYVKKIVERYYDQSNTEKNSQLHQNNTSLQ